MFELYFYCEMLESGNDGGGQMVRDWSKLGKLCPSAAKNGLARARGAKLCRVSSWRHHHQHQTQDHHHHKDQVQDQDQGIAKPKIELKFQTETRMRTKWRPRPGRRPSEDQDQDEDQVHLARQSSFLLLLATAQVLLLQQQFFDLNGARILEVLGFRERN